MTRRPTALVWLLLTALPALCAASEIAVPPNEPVAKRSQAEWSRAWWQWAGSFEDHDSPVADTTGTYCAGKQSGEVWFLAGTYGTRRTIRTCRVPYGKYLFFPLINYVVMPPPDRAVTCAAVRQSAASITDRPAALVLDLDGERIPGLERYRQATQECFDMGALADPKVRIYPSAANGYYVMLRPPSRGKHTLNFGGALPGMLQAVTYTLIVE